MGIYGTRDGKFTVRKLVVQDKIPVSYEVTNRVAIGSTDLIDGWDPSAGLDAITGTGFSAQPPYPMGLLMSPHEAGTAGAGDGVIVKGFNAAGDYLQETMYIKATVDATTHSNNAFSQITSIEQDDALHLSGDVNFGWNPVVFGLPYPLASTGDILEYTDGSTHATTAPYTFSKTYNTITDAAAVAGAVGTGTRILYLTKLQS